MDHELRALRALQEFYAQYAFAWVYQDLFAKLVPCSRDSEFALLAQWHMRREHAEFSSKRNVLERGRVIADAILRQARAVAAMWRHGLVEQWATQVENPLVKREFRLAWKGPFSLVAGSDSPLIFEQPVAALQGVYLWTADLRACHETQEDGYLVNYPGYTQTTTFDERLRYEVRRVRKGEDRYWNVDEFKCGHRVEISRELLSDEDRRANAEEILAACSVFVGVVLGEDQVRRRVEGALIRHFKFNASQRSRDFSGNTNPGMLPRTPPLSVHFSSPVKIIDLPESLVC